MNDDHSTSPITMDDIFALADHFKILRERRDALKNQLATANKELEETEYQLTDMMTEAECGSFSRGGKQFIMTTTTRWSAEAERKDDLYAALKANGYDHLFSVNTQTLGAFIREQVEISAASCEQNFCEDEPHVPGWLSGLVKSYDDIGITMKNTPKK